MTHKDRDKKLTFVFIYSKFRSRGTTPCKIGFVISRCYIKPHKFSDSWRNFFIDRTRKQAEHLDKFCVAKNCFKFNSYKTGLRNVTVRRSQCAFYSVWKVERNKKEKRPFFAFTYLISSSLWFMCFGIPTEDGGNHSASTSVYTYLLLPISPVMRLSTSGGNLLHIMSGVFFFF